MATVQSRKASTAQRKSVANEESELKSPQLDSQLMCRLMKKPPLGRTESDIEQIYQQAKLVKFFANYEAQHQTDIVRKCSRYLLLETFKEEEIVFNIDSDGDKFYIILEGAVEVHVRLNKDDTELKRVKILEKGESFGEIALIYLRPRLATIKCQKNCIFGVLSQKYFRKTLLQQETTKMLHEMNALFEMVLFNSWTQTRLRDLYLNSVWLSFKKGKEVYDINDPAESMFVIQEGEFVVYAKLSLDKEEQDEERLLKKGKESLRAKLGKYIKVRTLCQGEYFGEEEIIENCLRKYKIICNSFEGKALMIRKDHFLSNVFQDEISKKYIEIRLKEKEANIEQRLQNMRNSLREYQAYLFPPDIENNLTQSIHQKSQNEAVLSQKLISDGRSPSRHHLPLKLDIQPCKDGSLRGQTNSPKKTTASFTSFDQLEAYVVPMQKNYISQNKISQVMNIQPEQSSQQQAQQPQIPTKSMILDDILSSPLLKNRKTHLASIDSFDQNSRISLNLIPLTSLPENSHNHINNNNQKRDSSQSFSSYPQNDHTIPTQSPSLINNQEPNNPPVSLSLIKLIPTQPSVVVSATQQEAIQLKDQLLKDYHRQMQIPYVSQKTIEQKYINSMQNNNQNTKSNSFTLSDNVFLSLSPSGKKQRYQNQTTENLKQNNSSVLKDKLVKLSQKALTSRNTETSLRFTNYESEMYSENKIEKPTNFVENLLQPGSDRETQFSPFLKKRLKDLIKPQVQMSDEKKVQNSSKGLLLKQFFTRLPAKKINSQSSLQHIHLSQTVREKETEDGVQDMFNIRSFKIGKQINQIAGSNKTRNNIDIIDNLDLSGRFNKSVEFQNQYKGNSTLETIGMIQDEHKQQDSQNMNQLKLISSARNNELSVNNPIFNSTSQSSNKPITGFSPSKRLSSFITQQDPPSIQEITNPLALQSYRSADRIQTNSKQFLENKHKIFSSLLNKEKMKIQSHQQIELLDKSQDAGATRNYSSYFLGNVTLRENFTKYTRQDSSLISQQQQQPSFSILQQQLSNVSIPQIQQQQSPSQRDRIHSKNPGSCSPRVAKFKLRSVPEQKIKMKEL